MMKNDETNPKMGTSSYKVTQTRRDILPSEERSQSDHTKSRKINFCSSSVKIV